MWITSHVTEMISIASAKVLRSGQIGLVKITDKSISLPHHIRYWSVWSSGGQFGEWTGPVRRFHYRFTPSVHCSGWRGMAEGAITFDGDAMAEFCVGSGAWGGSVLHSIQASIYTSTNWRTRLEDQGPVSLTATDCPTGRRTILPCYLSIGRMVRPGSDGPSLLVKHPSSSVPGLP